MKFYIEGFPSYKKELEVNSLADVLNWASKRIIGRMDFKVYSSHPYTVDNLVYQHNKDEEIQTSEQMKNRILLSALALAEYPELSKVSAELNAITEYKPLMEILQDISYFCKFTIAISKYFSYNTRTEVCCYHMIQSMR